MTDDRRGLRRLALGSCPDSWGVWFAEDPLQTPWHRFLDELAEVGYEWLELGPYGYLPTDPARLQDELDKRALRVAGGTVDGHSRLHRRDEFPRIAERVRKVGELTQAVGGKHVIFVPTPGYRDDATGAYTEQPVLSADEWSTFIAATNELGRMLLGDFGIRLQFHPHADAHVETHEQTERFLDDTDPEAVSLCLDTGHLAYRHADCPKLIRDYPDRIGYVHLKQMDPAVLKQVEESNLAFGQAVKLGASCPMPLGVPEIEPIVDELVRLDVDMFVVVEQDMYPCDFDAPKPAAQKTNAYLRSIGIGVKN
jgi:inosose dehydratase